MTAETIWTCFNAVYSETTPSFYPTHKPVKQRDVHLVETASGNSWNWFSYSWILWKQNQTRSYHLFFYKILLYICFLLCEIFTSGERALKSQESNRTYRPQEVTKRTNLWKLLKLRRSTILPPSLGVGLQVRQGSPVTLWWAFKWFNCLGMNTMGNNPLLILLYSHD